MVRFSSVEIESQSRTRQRVTPEIQWRPAMTRTKEVDEKMASEETLIDSNAQLAHSNKTRGDREGFCAGGAVVVSTERLVGEG